MRFKKIYKSILIFVFLQVLDDQIKSGSLDDTRFYILRSEWFWTRIAEGYAPEDDFLFKDVSDNFNFCLIMTTNNSFST